MPLGVRWLRLKPSDGQEARFPVEQEKGPHIGWWGLMHPPMLVCNR